MMKSAQHRAKGHWQAGVKATQARQWPTAVAEFERAAALAPHDALMWMNLARACQRTGQLDKALQAAERAIAADPAQPLARRLLADGLSSQYRFDEAVQVYEGLPASAPRDQDWLCNHGYALFEARRWSEAVDLYFQALALNLNAPLVHYRLGLCFMDMGLMHQASECFRTAVSLDDEAVRVLALALLVHLGQQACEWQHLDADIASLRAVLASVDVSRGRLMAPFALLAIDVTPALQRHIGTLRVQANTAGLKPLPPAPPRRPGRIRVGYLSDDFYQHATSVLLAGMLEHRDRDHFDVTLYSHGRDDGTYMAQRMRRACDRFVDVTHLSNLEIARQMRDDGLDIVIDLKGHTRNTRFELLALRPAPVQAAYLGYPATTGADFIDYLIGDPVVTPLAHAADFSEHIAQLPGCYQPNDRARVLPDSPGRASVGLPEDAVVLCCFNQTYKISPHMLDLWARILLEAPNTVLWLLAWNPRARSNLERELEHRGISPQRIFWAVKLGLDDHLARLRCADLFLDTWPCNAHTTASEALWAGVPVLTVPGPTFASRVAASLVHACGLPEFACDSEAAYIELAVALAQAPATLANVKSYLEHNRLQLRPFDPERLAREFDALLLRMHERHLAGLPPAHLEAQELPGHAA
jgi:predicted O-linked N-acetylglucosamine transferase (SPINDLY family)